jgi:hypothetical protein
MVCIIKEVVIIGLQIYNALMIESIVNKMTNKQYHTVGTIPKSNIKIVERGKIY